MSGKFSKQEVSTMVASQVKEMGLNDIFNEEMLNKIKEQAQSKIKEESLLEEEVDTISEEDQDITSVSSSDYNDEEEEVVKRTGPAHYDPEVDQVPSHEPTISYEPEMPRVLDGIEPAKFIVFSQNELSEGGEGLANKPLRLADDPDVKKSLHQLWLDEGRREAEVYIAKFEKVGDLNFDYKNGTATFSEMRIEDPKKAPEYRDNAYANEAKPDLGDGSPEQRDMESYVKTAVDIEGQVKDYITDILKNHFSDMSHKNNEVEEPNYDMSQEEIVDDAMVYESDLTMKDIVTKNEFEKIDTPKELKESINGSGESAVLVSKNSEVQTWILEEKEYYVPVDIISNKKCYTKTL